MAKSYRAVRRDQPFLLPPDMRDWLPADHVVWFLLETVEALDTSAFHAPASWRGRDGGLRPGHDAGFLVYAYCQGVRSSRQVERRCLTDVAFRVVCAQDVPDHATIARFRAERKRRSRRCSPRSCRWRRRRDWCGSGTVAIDGTKIPANASIDANRGQEWLDEQVRQIIAEHEEQTPKTLRAATAAGDDAAARTATGAVRLRDRSRRAERIRRAALEVAEQTTQRSVRSGP